MEEYPRFVWGHDPDGNQVRLKLDSKGGMAGERKVIDYAVLTVSSTAVGFADATPAVTSAAKRVLVTVEDDSIRWRADGTAPTSSEGHLMYKGDVLSLTDADYHVMIGVIEFIRVTTDAKLKITYLD